MAPTLLGLHHVTAMTGDPQANIDFYTGTLGLRMVKLTVNYDDPSTYHLYYGDAVGSPGSAMTFFAWPGAHRGRHGTGQTTATAFAVPAASIPYWKSRLTERGVAPRSAGERFGEPVLAFDDPDGLAIELSGVDRPMQGMPWDRGGVPAQHAIRSFHSVTLSEEGYELTASLLTETLGFKKSAEAGNRSRYEPAAAGAGGKFVTYLDLLCQPDARRGTMGVGTVHHIALRTPDDEQHLQWHDTIRKLRFNVSPVIDRNYFHSIYFREPGGVLFEIATDGPGFTVDEPLEKLGTRLYLPPWLEPHRKEIEAVLPTLSLEGRGSG
jgi:catechol 2,3-dioxygenase-like lactoylglutathione lyase family enzyme